MPLCRLDNKMKVSPGSEVQKGFPLKFSDNILDISLGVLGHELAIGKIGRFLASRDLVNSETLQLPPPHSSGLGASNSATP